ncbi:hypothetical protein K457DRAFT_1820079 [Linnemannia elongata AG-77]|uniref:Uncharacterized protein n=1 Tax=Linnemannia elongata AG-77 TaxID=1314771 RepID=A0A197JX60_9FUNG|nr:hypothetical protein K457DRAFT_1820079 [Linnemannia elongata AG-77]
MGEEGFLLVGSLSVYGLPLQEPTIQGTPRGGVIRLGADVIIRNVLCPQLCQCHTNKEKSIVKTASDLEQVSSFTTYCTLSRANYSNKEKPIVEEASDLEQVSLLGASFIIRNVLYPQSCQLFQQRKADSGRRLGASFIIRNVLCPQLPANYSNKEKPIVEEGASDLEQVSLLGASFIIRNVLYPQLCQ